MTRVDIFDVYKQAVDYFLKEVGGEPGEVRFPLPEAVTPRNVADIEDMIKRDESMNGVLVRVDGLMLVMSRA